MSVPSNVHSMLHVTCCFSQSQHSLNCISYRTVCLTDKFPDSIGFIHGVHTHDARRYGSNVQLFALARFRLEFQFTALFVEWKPLDIHRAVSDGHLELAIPYARAVGKKFHLVLVATPLFLFHTKNASLIICQYANKKPADRILPHSRLSSISDYC